MAWCSLHSSREERDGNCPWNQPTKTHPSVLTLGNLSLLPAPTTSYFVCSCFQVQGLFLPFPALQVHFPGQIFWQKQRLAWRQAHPCHQSTDQGHSLHACKILLLWPLAFRLSPYQSGCSRLWREGEVATMQPCCRPATARHMQRMINLRASPCEGDWGWGKELLNWLEVLRTG